MDLLVLSGSTRRGSFNTRLAQLVRELRPRDRVTVVSNLAALPFYDADVEAVNIPPSVAARRGAVAYADAVVAVTLEYNGTVPGVLGNAVDWLSRPHGRSVLAGKPILVLSASPSRFGAARAAEHLRAVLGRIGAEVQPVGLSVAAAHQRLGELVDQDLLVQVTDVLAQVLDVALEVEPADECLALA